MHFELKKQSGKWYKNQWQRHGETLKILLERQLQNMYMAVEYMTKIIQPPTNKIFLKLEYNVQLAAQ